MNFDEAVLSISKGNSILILGSGYSYGARNIDASPIPSVAQMTNSFLDIAKITEEREQYDLETASESAFGKEYRQESFKYVSRSLRCKYVNDDHKEIVNRPWRRIYTTNYDDVAETALKESDCAFTSLSLSDNIQKKDEEINQIVHIHGSILNMTQYTFENEFFLTDKQGLDIAFLSSSWSKEFLDDLVFSQAVFFVGFSNSDFHIRKLIASVSHIRSKSFFIVGPKSSTPDKIRLGKYGEIKNIGIEGFSNSIKSAVKIDDKIEIQTPDCFMEKKYTNINSNDVAERESVVKEMYLGSINQDYFTKSITEELNTGIYFDRVSERFQSYILNPNNILIHGDAGNGKSVLINHIAAQLQTKYEKIFQFNGRQYDQSQVRNFFE